MPQSSDFGHDFSLPRFSIAPFPDARTQQSYEAATGCRPRFAHPRTWHQRVEDQSLLKPNDTVNVRRSRDTGRQGCGKTVDIPELRKVLPRQFLGGLRRDITPLCAHRRQLYFYFSLRAPISGGKATFPGRHGRVIDSPIRSPLSYRRRNENFAEKLAGPHHQRGATGISPVLAERRPLRPHHN
jgi:hypothetical protein